MIDIEQAAKDDVIVHDDLGTNVVVHWSHGGGGDQSVFDSAPVIVEERFAQPRLIPNPIEPRGCLAYGVGAVDEWTLVSATQIPHIAKVTLAGTTGIAGAEAPGDRTRRGRRVRIEAERVRGGGARPRPRAEASVAR